MYEFLVWIVWHSVFSISLSKQKFHVHFIWITKSIHYVYGIWQYKVIDIKMLFQSIIIWGEKNDRENLCDIYLNMIKAKNQTKIPLHYTKPTHRLSFKNINRKVDHHKEASGSSTAPSMAMRIMVLCWFVLVYLLGFGLVLTTVALFSNMD